VDLDDDWMWLCQMCGIFFLSQKWLIFQEEISTHSASHRKDFWEKRWEEFNFCNLEGNNLRNEYFINILPSVSFSYSFPPYKKV